MSFNHSALNCMKSLLINLFKFSKSKVRIMFGRAINKSKLFKVIHSNERRSLEFFFESLYLKNQRFGEC